MRRLDDRVTVSEQLRLEDLAALQAEGVRTVVNNRPDGEAPDQPRGEDIRCAAERLGLDYVAAPFQGRPPAEAVEALAAAVAGTQGGVHAFCKTGTRSSYAWALMAAGRGDPIDSVVTRGTEAGYDLKPLFEPKIPNTETRAAIEQSRALIEERERGSKRVK